MKKYRCKQTFIADSYDDNGFQIPNEAFIVKEGAIYEKNEYGSTIIGADVHLDGEDGSWVEISNETLERCFDVIE